MFPAQQLAWNHQQFFMPAATAIPGAPQAQLQQSFLNAPFGQPQQPAVTFNPFAVPQFNPPAEVQQSRQQVRDHPKPCPNGHECKLSDDHHLSTYTHEKPKTACPNGAGCQTQFVDAEHAAMYTHPKPRCKHGPHCLITEQDPSHGSAYDHSPEPAAAASADAAHPAARQQQQQQQQPPSRPALPTCQYGTREQCPLLAIDPMHEASYSHPAPAAAAAAAAAMDGQTTYQQQQQQGQPAVVVGGKTACRHGAACTQLIRGDEPHVSIFYHPDKQMCPLDADCPDQSAAHRDQCLHSCRYKQECHMFLGKTENPTHMRRYVH